MTHEEAVILGLDMFYDGKSPKEIKRQLGLKGFNEKECDNIFRMIEERERVTDLAKQKGVRDHQEEIRRKKMREIEKSLEEKKAREKGEDYSRTRTI